MWTGSSKTQLRLYDVVLQLKHVNHSQTCVNWFINCTEAFQPRRTHTHEWQRTVNGRRLSLTLLRRCQLLALVVMFFHGLFTLTQHHLHYVLHVRCRLLLKLCIRSQVIQPATSTLSASHCYQTVQKHCCLDNIPAVEKIINLSTYLLLRIAWMDG